MANDAAYVRSSSGYPTPPMDHMSAADGSDEEDSFERKLKELLKDSAVNRSSVSVHGDVSSEMTFIGGADTRPEYRGNSLGMFDSSSSGEHVQRPSTLQSSSSTGFNTAAHNSMPPRQPAMTNVSLSCPESSAGFGASAPSDRHITSPPPSSNSSLAVSTSQSKLDDLREWSFSTYKFTRQLMSERLGRAERTVDAELEAQIADLRETQSKYTNVLNLTRDLTTHFSRMLVTQRTLSDAFGDLSQKNPELHDEFTYNAETQKVLARNGDNLLRALTMFTSTLNTLCNKTITDTLFTVKQYEAARVEFDAYRLDLEALLKLPRDSSVTLKLSDAESRHKLYKDKYERLRADVAVKIRFLDENRVKVMHKQLLLFHNAVASYFSGNQLGLEETLKQFNIRMKTPHSDKLSTFLAASSP